MSDQDPIDAPATPSAIKTPLEDSPALLDPAAVGFVPQITGGAAGAVDSSAGSHPAGEPAPAAALAGLPDRGGHPALVDRVRPVREDDRPL